MNPDYLLRAPVPPTGPLALECIRVLCVDDDDDTCELVRIILEGAGAKVVSASSVQAALETLARVKPHLLIADLQLPDGDGYDLLFKVRRLPPEQGGAGSGSGFNRLSVCQ